MGWLKKFTFGEVHGSMASAIKTQKLSSYMEDRTHFYKILGLELGASASDVKQAYRDLVRVWHPDRYAHDPRLQKKAEEKLKEINEAYEKIIEFYSSIKGEGQKSRTEEEEREYKSGGEEDIRPSKHNIDKSKNTANTIIIGSVIIGVVLVIWVVINISRTSQTVSQSAAVLPRIDPRYLSTFDAFNQQYGLIVPPEASKSAATMEELNKNGIAFIEAGNYQQAINEFNKLIELNPVDHEAYNSRGEAYLKLGNFKQAKEDFNRAIISIKKQRKINGLPALHNFGLEKIYYRNRGLAYEKLGNKNQAIDDMKTAAKEGDKEAQKYLLSREMDW